MKYQTFKRLLAAFVTLMLLLGCMAGIVGAAQPAGYIILSIEKLTLGQGFIFEPQRVPYYDGETMAQVLDRVLTEQGREYHSTGSLTDGFYLAELEDPDRPGIANTVPAYIYDMWSALKAGNPSLRSISDKDTMDPEFLGEFDYFSQSGWMYSVNNVFLPVGAASCYAADGLVVRWQFSLVGLGGDLGGNSTTAAGSRSFMNRTELYTILAAVRADSALMADSEIRPVYDRVLKQCEDITVEKETMEDDIAILKRALGGNQISELLLPEEESGIRTCAFGTDAETAAKNFPTYLRATIDGKSKLITGITWTTDAKLDLPGTYAFRPILPQKYNRYTLTAELPTMQVRVLPPSGDINGDTLLDVRDLSRLAGNAGQNADFCDLDGNGLVTWNDFRLLAAFLGDNALNAPDAPENIPLTIVFDKAQYTAGEQATAYLRATREGFDTFVAALSFDERELTLQSVTLTEPFLQAAYSAEPGSARLCGVTLEGAAQGEIAVLTFTVETDCTPQVSLSRGGTALLYNGGYLGSETGGLSMMALHPGAFAPGDVDESGTVDMDDAIRLLEYCNGRANLSNEQLRAADLNGDGEVNLVDAALLFQFCNGLIDRFPLGE